MFVKPAKAETVDAHKIYVIDGDTVGDRQGAHPPARDRCAEDPGGPLRARAGRRL
jgi:hypothetical protein